MSTGFLGRFQLACGAPVRIKARQSIDLSKEQPSWTEAPNLAFILGNSRSIMSTHGIIA